MTSTEKLVEAMNKLNQQGVTYNKILITKNFYKLIMMESREESFRYNKELDRDDTLKIIGFNGKPFEIAKFGGEHPKELYSLGFLFTQ